MMAWVSIVSGLVVLTLGAELLVRGASAMARRLGLSELLIGLTLVGFGTSTPELVSSIEAARAGAPGIALGNVVGSNIANILLILGLSALIAPIAAPAKAFRRDSAALALATLAAVVALQFSEIGRIAGAALFAGLCAYLTIAFVSERKAVRDAEAERHVEAGESLPAASGGLPMAAAQALVGLVALILGAKLLVSGAVSLAASAGLSEALIGLTVVAVGTSLPELMTSVVAAMRGKSALALGNVVGSNLYNILGILGLTALALPISVDPDIAGFDGWVMAAATLGLIVFARTGGRIVRWEGALLVGAYGLYLAWLVAAA